MRCRSTFERAAAESVAVCNRYERDDPAAIASHFKARALAADTNVGRSIVHPKDPGLVVRVDDGERVVDQMTWGFPVMLKGKSGQPLKPRPVNNARFDKLGTFWKRWAAEPRQRCLIPVKRYAEAVGPSGSMTETWLSRADGDAIAWAGLWRSSPEWGDCYTGVMTDAPAAIAKIHDRMPVMLHENKWDEWLSAPFDALQQFARARPDPSEIRIDATETPWRRSARAPV
jgi:putative SOS response-associated peptidase YedK